MEVEEYGYVYAIGYDGEVKIGISSYDPRKRLNAMQAGNPRLLGLIATSYVRGYQQIERILHQELKTKRKWIRGEWYRLTLEEAQAVIESVGEDLISKAKAEAAIQATAMREYCDKVVFGGAE